MPNNFKRGIDREKWVSVTPSPNAHAAGGCLASDLRNNLYRHPHIYQLVSASVLNRYNIFRKSWQLAVNPGLGGTFGAGAGCVFAPSFSLVGSIGAGCTTSRIVTTTALGTAVGVNQLASRGGSDDQSNGYVLRVIGNAAGSSGKVEERWIVANTSGTTPTLWLDSPLSFTPVNGDTYEILSGRVLMLSAGTLAATIYRSYCVATQTLTSLTNTNLPATISTDFSGVVLDEQYVPYTRIPGEGMIVGASKYDGTKFGCLVATATAAGSITGQASGGDAGVTANRFRNFQIRIVEDTSAPTAVNQRRIIASHTAGPSPVYTLGTNWTVTPSSNAKFVIELPNLFLLWSSASTNTHTYNYTNATINNGTNSIASNAWSTTYFGARGGAMAAGCISFPSFGIEPDAGLNALQSNIFSFRGGGASTLDVLDIAGAITGSWSNAITYDGATLLLTTGSCGIYSPADLEGKFGYLNFYTASAINQMFRFDVRNRALSPIPSTDWIQAGTAAVGERLASVVVMDGQDKYSLLLLLAHLATNAFELIVEM